MYIHTYLDGTCGTGGTHYLLCQQCHQRYLEERDSKAMKTSGMSIASDEDIPYGRLLLMAPDLLGSANMSLDRSKTFLFTLQSFT